jgi:putative Ca2+/H+ antiporter (TMEM165/GDT1 family)
VNLELVLSTFGIVFLAELPDKTALASLVLATHLPARQVIIGAWLAFLVQTAVAVLAGSVLQVFPVVPVRIAAGLGFLVFALIALRRNVEQEIDEERHDVQSGRGRRSPPWVASFLVVFAAEWGDLTQLATAGLVAHTGQPLEVGLGALAALWSVTLLAATAGTQLSRFVGPTLLNRVSAALFAAIGVFIIVSTLLAAY